MIVLAYVVLAYWPVGGWDTFHDVPAKVFASSFDFLITHTLYASVWSDSEYRTSFKSCAFYLIEFLARQLQP